MPRPKGSKNKPKTPTDDTLQRTMQLEFPTEKDFKNLVRKVKVAEGTKNEGVSEMGGIISDAVEKKHLDKRAFSIFRRLDRLDDDKLAICLAHLDHYRRIGLLDERASRQAELFQEAQAEEPERGEEPEQTPRRGRPPLRAVENEEEAEAVA